MTGVSANVGVLPGRRRNGVPRQAMMVIQIQLTKRQGVVPLTRDYIAREEARLRAGEGGSGRRCGSRASRFVRIGGYRRQRQASSVRSRLVQALIVGTIQAPTSLAARPCANGIPVGVRPVSVAGECRATNSSENQSTGRSMALEIDCAQAGRRTRRVLSHRAAQYRGGAIAAGRDPRQQRGVLSRLRFSGTGAFLRAGARADLRASPAA